MSLLAYNLTAANLPVPDLLAVPARFTPGFAYPTSGTAGVRGPAVDVTNEMRGRSNDNYVAMQNQQNLGLVSFAWTMYEEYPTPGLIVQIGAQAPATLAHPEYPVMSATATFDEPDIETGRDRSITIIESAEYRLRILRVFCTITRGAPGAQMYVCCYPRPSDNPHLSDIFDASSPGQKDETAMLRDRIREPGRSVYAIVTNDYVLGQMSVLYQRIA